MPNLKILGIPLAIPDGIIFVSVWSTGVLPAFIENVVAYAMLLPIIKELIPLIRAENPEKETEIVQISLD